jgi:hypothetical protein
MRLLRVRFTVRRLLAAVAIAGFGFGLLARRERLQRIASYHAAQAAILHEPVLTTVFTPRQPGEVLIHAPELLWTSFISEPGKPTIIFVEPPNEPPAGFRLTSSGEWHLKMREKYRNAASHPWLPVEPDLPEPR